MGMNRSFAILAACSAVVAGGAVVFGAMPGTQSTKATNAASASQAKTATQPIANVANAQQTSDGSASCAAIENALTGGWKAASDSTEYEQIAFAIEDGKRVFSTWLHMRPEIVGGSWSINGCIITLNAPNAAMYDQDYEVSMPDNDSLNFTPPPCSDYGTLRFKRVKA
jgi:hypothetical protein